MKKQVVISTIVFSALIVTLIVIAAQTPIDASRKTAQYVQRLGWVIDEKPLEKVGVDLPPEFDNVYKEYNKIQKLAGFDLTDYMGKSVMRYTFSVKNFEGVEGVRANVLVYRGKIIGGDIMTVAIDGFMIPLKKK